MKMPEYIRLWHGYVDAEPQKHSRAVRQLRLLVEKLLKQKNILFDPIDVDAFETFCKLLRHKEGKWAGLPLELTREQKYIAACVLGIKVKNDDGRWIRFFREMVLIVARKWGKSVFISVLGLYFTCADREPAAQVWCLATVKAQAEIVWQNAVDFADDSPVLREHLRRRKDTSGHRLVHADSRSYMKAGDRNSQTKDGLNPHAFIIDECHAIKDRNTYDVFSSATGAREQPMGIIISTNGFTRESIFDSVYDRCKKVLAELDLAMRLFPMIFEIDDDDDPNDESCWGKANPGLGDRPTIDYLRNEYVKAKSDPAQWPSFLAKHLNRASNSSAIFFDLQTIDQCAGDIQEKEYTNCYAVGGVDLAETTDLCCASAIIPINGKLNLIQRYFVPAGRIEQNSKSDKMAYLSFTETNAPDAMNRQLLQVCDGPMVRKSDVTQWFIELAEKYQVTFWKIGFDRWHGGDWVDEMEMNGFPKEDRQERGVTFPVAMGAITLSTPMKETKALFESDEVRFSRHNGLFRWCTTNTAALIDQNNNVRPDKSKSRARIDGYVSFLIAYIAYKKVKDMFIEYQA
jgi:phage terminase large subunit-like protein